MPHSNIPNDHASSNGPAPAAGRRPNRPNITVRLGEEEEEIRLAELLDAGSITQWQQRLLEYQGQPHFRIRDLQALSDETRFNLFSLIASRASHVVTIGDDRRNDSPNLFGAVLDAINSDASIEECECLRRSAVEAAALCHPSALEFACKRIAETFRAAGLGGPLPQSLVKQARALLGDTEPQIVAEQAAREFIANIKSTLLLANSETLDQETLVDGPATMYFGAEYFTFAGSRWLKSPVKEFQAQVAAYLQQSDRGRQVTRKFIGDVVANLEGMSLLPRSDHSLPLWLDADWPYIVLPSPYIAFQDGLLNLQEALQGQPQLCTHNPRHFSTTFLPYGFDPAARWTLWSKTLSEIFPPQSDRQLQDRRVEVLQEFFGYCLLPHNMQYEKSLVMFGEGANGKSTIMTTLTNFLGIENVSHVSIEKIGQEFWLARMMGMYANVTADMNWVDRIAEGMFKALVSGDWVDANRKNLPQVPMKPTAKLVFGTNTLPPFHDRSNGIWRRLILMPLSVEFAGDGLDHHRAEQLREELPGIFNWALEGARRLLQQDRFTHCDVCQAALDQHRFESNPVEQFLDECTIRDSGGSVLSGGLYGNYREWCADNGRRPCASSEFGKQILAIPGIGKGRETTGHRRPRTYTGFRLVRPYVPRLSLGGPARW